MLFASLAYDNIYNDLRMMQKRIYRRNRLPNERANKHLQTTYKTVAVSTIDS